MTANELNPTRRVQPYIKQADAQDAEPLGYLVFCPGCQQAHHLAVREPNGMGAQWSFNGDLERPTFSPSLLSCAHDDALRCHSFIRDGRFEFLSDCHHDLAGTTVDVPVWKDDLW